MAAMSATETMTRPAEPDDRQATVRHQQFVTRLAQTGRLSAPGLLAAFRAVPRHRFLPDLPLNEVYQDRAIATKHCDGLLVSSSSQPTMMALMLAQLDVRPGQRVLEIGAGTGYNAALLAELVGQHGQVTTVEYDADLATAARDRLHHLGYDNIEVVAADGIHGYEAAAPFDRILLSVAADDLAPAWREQLQPQGWLVLPLILTAGLQLSVAFQGQGNVWRSRSLIPCSFMSLRGAAVGAIAAPAITAAPGCKLRTSQCLPLDTATLMAWLAAPEHCEPLGLWVTRTELVSGLRLWLALGDRRFGELLAEPGAAEPVLPPTLGAWGRSYGLVDHGGLAMLVRQALPSVPADAEAAAELVVVGVGPERAIATALADQVRAWHHSGRPTVSDWHVRAYPAPDACPSDPDTLVLARPWTHLCLSHSTSSV
ncbi:MAG: methyltransferase domain-containing protein [Spirulinaceae cyanobacterium SM2_1_0]|nr:methyltransferase domain-containing protein [Spirulinaceae cyanobacterium SM2_1_0]